MGIRTVSIQLQVMLGVSNGEGQARCGEGSRESASLELGGSLTKEQTLEWQDQEPGSQCPDLDLCISRSIPGWHQCPRSRPLGPRKDPDWDIAL